MSPLQGAPDDNQVSTLEMAYVLFMDIVGYSRMPTDVQQETLRRLQNCVRSGKEFRKAQEQQRLISLPTGDGMALAFFGDPESSVRCAVETTTALKLDKEIPLRIGLHAGPVYRVTDINANQNVAGDGINVAQRVMDCGDAGHILVSKALADVLRQLTSWKGALQDLGEASVKHGVRVHVFNLLIEGAGNPQKPQKFQTPTEKIERAGDRRQKWLTWGSVAAGVLAIVGVVGWRVLRNAQPAYAYRPKIALLGFKDQMGSNETEWVNWSLTENITRELEAGEKIQTIPGETVSHMKKDLGLPDETSYSAETMARLHAYLQCDFVVYGSYFDPGKTAGGSVKLSVRMQNTKTGEMFPLMADEGTELTLGELSTRVAAGLRSRLGLANLSLEESQQPQKSMPVTAEGKKYYALGLQQFWAYDLLGAQKSLEKAVEVEPNFALSHAELAQVWRAQGYDEKAREEAKEALGLSKQLANVDRVLVEAEYDELNSDWESAARLYRSVWDSSLRERPEYAYREANAQIRAGKAQEALGTIEELRKRPGAMADNPVVDLREAEAYESLGNAKQVDSAARAAEKAQKIGARMLEAEALWRVCWAKSNLGDGGGARSACDEGQTLARATDYGLVVARAYAVLGNILMSEGNLAQAVDFEQKALEIARSIGSQRDVIGALQNAGNFYGAQGNHEEAVKSYTSAQQVAEQIKDKSAVMALLNNIAAEYQAGGELKKALESYGKSLTLAKETQDQRGQIDAEGNIGSAAAAQGRLASGLESAKAALKRTRDGGLKEKLPVLLCIVGDIQVDQGDLNAASASYSEAMSIANELGDRPGQATVQLAQSRMEFERGNYADAAKDAKIAAEEFQKEGRKEDAGAALIALAEGLTELGQLNEAKASLGRSKETKVVDKAILLSAGRAEMRLLAKSGQGKEAASLEVQALREAKKFGFLGWELRLELVSAECGLGAGNPAGKRALLLRLEKKASSSGYGLIKERARRLLGEQATAKTGNESAA
jgi:tetratricopeptide (TPR) repeat protein/class 3 adenylate cyclase/TolB-like protein